MDYEIDFIFKSPDCVAMINNQTTADITVICHHFTDDLSSGAAKLLFMTKTLQSAIPNPEDQRIQLFLVQSHLKYLIDEGLMIYHQSHWNREHPIRGREKVANWRLCNQLYNVLQAYQNYQTIERPDKFMRKIGDKLLKFTKRQQLDQYQITLSKQAIQKLFAH